MGIRKVPLAMPIQTLFQSYWKKDGRKQHKTKKKKRKENKTKQPGQITEYLKDDF